jgi:hypothetical protein
LKFVPIYSPWRSHWRTIPPSTPVTKEGAGRHRDATTEEIGSQHVRIINFPFKYIQLVLLNLCNIHKWKEKKNAEKRFYIIKNHLNLIFWQYKIFLIFDFWPFVERKGWTVTLILYNILSYMIFMIYDSWPLLKRKDWTVILFLYDILSYILLKIISYMEYWKNC